MKSKTSVIFEVILKGMIVSVEIWASKVKIYTEVEVFDIGIIRKLKVYNPMI